MDNIKNTVLFRKLGADHWAAIQACIDLEVVGTNTMLTTATSQGDTLYYIVKGSVLLLMSIDGTEHPLLVLHAGEYFGEFSVLQPGTRVFSAKAAENCTLAKISHTSLAEVRTENPAAHWAFASNLLRLVNLKARFLLPIYKGDLETLLLAGKIGPTHQT